MNILIGSYGTRIGLLQWSEQESSVTAFPAHPNPSWLSYVNEDRLLFAVEESADCGRLYSYLLSGEDQQLHFISSCETAGRYPCHILKRRDCRQLYVCNYMGGPITLFRYDAEGQLHKERVIDHPVDFDPARRTGANAERQEMSHPHSCLAAPDGEGVFAADLGHDQIVYHPFNAEASVAAQLPVGYGPRHMCVNRAGCYLYVLCELHPLLLSLKILAGGGLELKRECKVTRTGKASQCSEICSHPLLPYLYAANRGAGCVAQIRMGGEGAMELIEEFVLAGTNPRHMAVSPDGRYLLAALQESDQVQVFAVHPERGTLQQCGGLIPFAKPAHIHFIEI